MIRLAQTPLGEVPVRVVAGRVLSVAAWPAVDDPAGLGCTRLLIEHDNLVRELLLVHLEPLDIQPHRNLTLLTGCEVEREWPLYIYSPTDKNHRRFDEHIARFLEKLGGKKLSKGDQRVIWSAILLQVLPG